MIFKLRSLVTVMVTVTVTVTVTAMVITMAIMVDMLKMQRKPGFGVICSKKRISSLNKLGVYNI
jgi:hypothetical protein